MRIQGQSVPSRRRGGPLWANCCGLMFVGSMVALIVTARNDPGPKKELQLASGYIRSGNYAQAESVLLAASRKYPGSADVANEMAWTLYLEHKYAEAEPYAVHSVARRRRAFNLDTLAHVELGLGKFDTAEVGFKEVLELDPKNADSLDGLGQVCERKGRPADALSYYTRARSYKPAIIGIDDRIAHVQQMLGQKPAQ